MARSTEKFATMIESDVARDLRAYASASDRSIASVVNEALAEYLQRYRVRPAFQAAMDEVVTDHGEVLARLAR
jgi:predicted transcriptional regulator